MAMRQASLFEPSNQSALIESAGWFESILLGQLAIGLCAIAVALLGLWMLSGRLNLGQGLRTLLGVFVLLGAPAIAASFVASSDQPRIATTPTLPRDQTPARALPPASNDPYAGASLRRD
ncbi:TrbC/VirB2 family protein [uncultured Erythrobacter sp.]|uniref:TrbC/VirB2 family protein n=1 Tax=uncultured Erythrobacter sp. TaxID=263913 RepID=UPI0034424CCE